MLFNLSLRNIVRYRRRNFFLFAAIAVAVGSTTLSNALIRGWQVDMLDTAVSGLTATWLQASGFADDPSLQNAFSSLPRFPWAMRFRFEVCPAHQYTGGDQQ